MALVCPTRCILVFLAYAVLPFESAAAWDLPLFSSYSLRSLGVWVFPAVRPSQRSGWEKKP